MPIDLHPHQAAIAEEEGMAARGPDCPLVRIGRPSERGTGPDGRHGDDHGHAAKRDMAEKCGDPHVDLPELRCRAELAHLRLSIMSDR